jgi:hypothetical protein
VEQKLHNIIFRVLGCWRLMSEKTGKKCKHIVHIWEGLSNYIRGLDCRILFKNSNN